MMDFLTTLENLPFSIWVRESGSLWAYPGILFLHTVGLAIVVGVSTAVSLRALGLGAAIPIAPLEAFYKVFWLGFWVNLLSGAALLIADATTKLVNPVFYIKIALIIVAMVVTVRLRRRLFHGPSPVGAAAAPPRVALLATSCLVLWAAAITAGRLMAYLGPVSGAPGLINSFGR